VVPLPASSLTSSPVAQRPGVLNPAGLHFFWPASLPHAYVGELQVAFIMELTQLLSSPPGGWRWCPLQQGPAGWLAGWLAGRLCPRLA
jgi:hypothetical protein